MVGVTCIEKHAGHVLLPGCEIEKKGGILTVTFKGRIMIRVKRSVDNLYRLTVPRTSPVARVARSQDEDEEKLWREAELKEVRQHVKMKTLGPPMSTAKVKGMGYEPVPLDWIRTHKVLEDGGTKRKSRAVIRGKSHTAVGVGEHGCSRSLLSEGGEYFP